MAWSNSSNSSSSNDSFCVEYLHLRPETQVETNIKLAVYTIAFIIAIIGNILVIAIVLRKSQVKTTANMFIINMAVSDLLMAMVCMPTTIFTIASDNRSQMIVKGALGTAICKMVPFLQGLASAASVLTFLMLAADRYLAIVYPFTRYITRKRAKLLIAVIWIVGAFMNAPLLYAMNVDEYDYCIEIWEPHFDTNKATIDYTIVIFVFLYVLPLMLITFLYSALIKELWRSVQSTKTVAYNENKAVLKMLVTIIVIFAVCWLPIHVTLFYVYFSNDSNTQRCGINPVVYFIGWFMGHVNCSINPIIYFSFNERFQQELIKLVRGLKDSFRRNKRRRSRGTTASFVKPSIIVTQFTTNQARDSLTSTGIPNAAYDGEQCTITVKI